MISNYAIVSGRGARSNNSRGFKVFEGVRKFIICMLGRDNGQYDYEWQVLKDRILVDLLGRIVPAIALLASGFLRNRIRPDANATDLARPGFRIRIGPGRFSWIEARKMGRAYMPHEAPPPPPGRASGASRLPSGIQGAFPRRI